MREKWIAFLDMLWQWNIWPLCLQSYSYVCLIVQGWHQQSLQLDTPLITCSFTFRVSSFRLHSGSHTCTVISVAACTYVVLFCFHFMWNLLSVHSKFCVQTRLYACLCVCSRCIVYSLCSFGNVHLLLCVSYRQIHSKYIYAELYNFPLCSCLSKSSCLYVVLCGFFSYPREESWLAM